MAVKESLKVNYFQIKSNITDETIDLRAGTPIIEYRESIFSPYVEVTGYLADTDEKTVPDASLSHLSESCQSVLLLSPSEILTSCIA